MAVQPVVRNLIVCEDMRIAGNKISLLDLVLNIHASFYPAILKQLCVFAVLTEVRGVGKFHLRIHHADEDTTVFVSKEWSHQFGNDPLKAHGLPIRLRHFLLPSPGLYSIQLWYNDALLKEQELFAR